MVMKRSLVAMTSENDVMAMTNVVGNECTSTASVLPPKIVLKITSPDFIP